MITLVHVQGMLSCSEQRNVWVKICISELLLGAGAQSLMA